MINFNMYLLNINLLLVVSQLIYCQNQNLIVNTIFSHQYASDRILRIQGVGVFQNTL